MNGSSPGLRVRSLETLHCDAGWRNYNFVKLTTDAGITGWSEFDEGFGSPGVTAAIRRLAARVVGADAMRHERIFADLSAVTRPAAGGVVGQALGAIENALLDAKAKALGVPCHVLLGGALRQRLRVYWSHCGTYRINRSAFYGPPVRGLDGIRALGREVRDRGFTALKTNIFLFEEDAPAYWRPGFGAPFAPERVATPRVIRNLVAQMEAFADGAGPDGELLLDLNFNIRPESGARLLAALAHLPLLWVEMDCADPAALARLRARSPHPIASGETLIGAGAFLPFLRAGAMDVAVVDAVWNGAWQSLKIAAAADAHEVNIAPHNFYGHLSTMISAAFSAAVPNLRIVELDVDRIAWDDALFTVAPRVEAGELVLPDTPGWGTEPVEAAIRAHPPRDGLGIMDARG